MRRQGASDTGQLQVKVVRTLPHRAGSKGAWLSEGRSGSGSSREPLGAMGCCIVLRQLTQVGAHPGVLAKPTTQTSPGPQQPCWLCGWADPTLLTDQETWPSGFSGFDS